eukprot:5624327-Pyramimonas_sp.AAC.1
MVLRWLHGGAVDLTGGGAIDLTGAGETEELSDAESATERADRTADYLVRPLESQTMNSTQV